MTTFLKFEADLRTQKINYISSIFNNLLIKQLKNWLLIREEDVYRVIIADKTVLDVYNNKIRLTVQGNISSFTKAGNGWNHIYLTNKSAIDLNIFLKHSCIPITSFCYPTYNVIRAWGPIIDRGFYKLTLEIKKYQEFEFDLISVE